MREDGYYGAILREMIMIKKRYCENCEKFIDKQCIENRIYRECLLKNERRRKIMVKVKATDAYKKNPLNKPILDNELQRVPEVGEIFEVSEERFNKLSGSNIYGLVFVEKVEEEKKEEKKTTTKKKTSKKKIS